MKTLRETVERLEEIVEKVEEDVTKDAVRYGFEPEMARDANGRYLLLDAYNALAAAKAALEMTTPRPVIMGLGPVEGPDH